MYYHVWFKTVDERYFYGRIPARSSRQVNKQVFFYCETQHLSVDEIMCVKE
jgi:hypothetical protein